MCPFSSVCSVWQPPPPSASGPENCDNAKYCTESESEEQPCAEEQDEQWDGPQEEWMDGNEAAMAVDGRWGMESEAEVLLLAP